MRKWSTLTLAAVAGAVMVLTGCGTPSGLGPGHPYDRDATMRPDLLVVGSPARAPGEQFEVTFPAETMRGTAWVLEEPDGSSWNLRWFISAAPESHEGFTAPSWWAYEDWEGKGWTDVGVGGPGPDLLVIPDETRPGTYRLCTANSVDNICTEVDVVDG